MALVCSVLKSAGKMIDRAETALSLPNVCGRNVLNWFVGSRSRPIVTSEETGY